MLPGTEREETAKRCKEELLENTMTAERFPATHVTWHDKIEFAVQ